MRKITLLVLIYSLTQALYGQVLTRILFQPESVRIGNSRYVYYEIHLENKSNERVSIRSVHVYSSSTPLLALTGTALIHRFHKADSLDQSVNADLLPGESGVIYLEYPLPLKERDSIVHDIVLGKPSSTNQAIESIHLTMRYPTRSHLVVSAPVEPGKWAAIYEPSWQRGHRRVFYSVDGMSRLPGRFAIDFIKMNDQGLYALGNSDSIRNWYGYNTRVLAVADGVVVAVDNSYSESKTLAAHQRYPLDKATGNYVTLDIGGYYAFYEHLTPNSIKVKIGDTVKKGDVLASLGFTGNTTGPHLHFHIADKNSPLGAESVPFVFDAYTYLGEYEDFNEFGVSLWKARDKKPNRKRERPVPNSVIEFK